MSADNLQRASAGSSALQPSDQHIESGGVHEGDRVEVDNQMDVTLADQVSEGVPQVGTCVDVQFRDGLEDDEFALTP